MNSVSKPLIRLEEVTISIDDDESLLKSKIVSILELPEADIINYTIVKRNIDSRQKNILFVYSLNVEVKDIKVVKNWPVRHRARLIQPFAYQEKKALRSADQRIVVVGSGPCGLFSALLLAKAGLKPLVIERGKEISARVKDVAVFMAGGAFNPQSNIQFGEGGAGTFSDGKLYTLINDPRSQYIFQELVKAGAPEDIFVNAAPHIGTDKLRAVIYNLRQEIIRLGGEFRFEICLTDLIIENNKISAVVLNGQEKLPVNEVVIATGHSARDTYRLLYEKELAMIAKPFSIGLRIEHRADMINRAQYGAACDHSKLGAARYKLVQHLASQRPVYSFCMCPGGYVMGAASEEGGVVTNGMSEYSQNGENSNSALLVPVTPADFGSDHPLAGIDFQRRWERAAYLAGGSNYSAPAQLVEDFLAGRSSNSFKNIKPSYRPGVKMTSLESCLPDFVIKSLREAIPLLDKKIKGFAHSEAILTGVETRSSAPLRLERNQLLESNIAGIYPAGEGAGHAGGIVSSAIDGLSVAEAIIEKYQ